MNRMLEGWVSSVVMLRLGKSLGEGVCGHGRGGVRAAPAQQHSCPAERPEPPHRNMVCTLTMVLASAM